MRHYCLAFLLTAFLFPLNLVAQSESNSDERNGRQNNSERSNQNENGKRGKKGRRGQKNGQRQMNPEKMFQRLDQNQDSVIVAGELPERLRERIGAADSNQDGEINKQEFMAHVKKMMARRGGRGPAGQMQRGNPNNRKENGRKSRQGEKGARQKQDRNAVNMREVEKLDAQQVMSRLDRNDNGSLEKSELPKMMASKLQKIDTDGNEIISLSELRSAIEHLKAKAMDAGKGRYSTDSKNSKGQVPKRPPVGDDSDF